MARRADDAVQLEREGHEIDVLAVWCQVVLAAVFAEALWTHLRNPARLREAAAAVGFRLPWTTGLVVTGDLVVFVLLVADARSGGAAALIYLAAVTGPFMVALHRGQVLPDCGCGVDRVPADIHFVARNAMFGAAALTLVTGANIAQFDLTFALGATAALVTRALPGAVHQLAHGDGGHPRIVSEMH